MRSLLVFCLLIAAPAFAEPSISVSFQHQTGDIVQLIDGAKRSIRVAAYGFTSKPIAEALVHAKQRGVDVQAVLDRSNATVNYSAATFLANQSIPTRINARHAIMHDKFLVVDSQTTETGSFNFSRAAEEKNAENVIILREHPEIAAQYEAEWTRLWNESQPYSR